MAIPSFPIFFFVCHLLLFHSSLASNKTHNDCPEEFPCGGLNTTRFPLTQSSRPDCGLLMVDCDAKPYPKLELRRDVYDIQYQDVPFLQLSDQKLSGLLQNRSCQSFNRNISFPNSPSVTYRVSPIITLLKCSNISSNKTGFNVPPHCSVIQLPLKQNETSNNATDLFAMLGSEFFISWFLTENCSECHYRLGGQCVTDKKTNQFRCVHSSSSSPWKGILAAVLASGFVISLGIIFTIWFFKKRTKFFSHKNSRNTSSDATMDVYSEEHSNYFGAPMFSYSELQEATNNFDASKELGDGAFGTVYHGKLRDGREVAVKRLYEFNPKRTELFMNEVEIISRLRHPNLVTLYGRCTSRHSHGLLVYEYVCNGTLADHLHGQRAKEGLLSWPIRMNVAIETAGALAYLHATDVIHRDVKTSNILLDSNFGVKVSDFGLSRLFPDNVTHVSTAPQGTPGYVDPEYNECFQLTDKSDVYSFGVVLIELLSSMPAVDITRHRHEINLANFAMTKILRHEIGELIDPFLGVETDNNILHMTTKVAELGFQCLQPEKEMRPSMDEVLATLIDIQNGEFRDWKEDNHEVLIAPSSEDAILLKKTKSPASTDSLTDNWINSSSTSSTSGGYPNK
ncbi:LEAF RUST 10 DISEASE-RESISTANCE LOCUS RECEPTOR-LIKE PROTEIN KINASE-like 1.1 isoform X2 [Ipomoea triloba]|uniref:LEAF RUST 10 DISEASE-RESISTANCE LOCUS RECEPTOR-LIKE PROTEIN KINASE-like 1.1 isoform X2 n=1 Tax=Ipomoea triloba TaxID=35885 RepID=UPI00125E6BCE|nr:LEAF RUST 10 DISEASE-RESISTANCE LOCUS RECEPTOR-LIKE PROTEIN KINASE-like 1.1 isoform X2 [Ipomoea triloba]